MSTPPTSRPIPAGVDGSFTLRTGRLYRLLLVVLDANELDGTPTADELADALIRIGFGGDDLALSMNPEEWAEERPPDWPEEAAAAISANEHLVRASGSFAGGRMRVLRDTPIAGGGTLTIVQAWDYGPALEPGQREALTTTGAGGASPTPDRSNVLVVGVLAVTGIAAWNFMKTGRRLEKEEEKFFSLEARADRARMGARIRDLMSEGYTPTDAEAVAAHERITNAEHAELEAEFEAAAAEGAG
jgi:hypothetical protein